MNCVMDVAYDEMHTLACDKKAIEKELKPP